MEPDMTAHSALTFCAWIFLQLLSSPHALYLTPPSQEEEDRIDPLRSIMEGLRAPSQEPHESMALALHNFRLCTSFNVFGDDLGYWVKPRSTT